MQVGWQCFLWHGRFAVNTEQFCRLRDYFQIESRPIRKRVEFEGIIHSWTGFSSGTVQMRDGSHLEPLFPLLTTLTRKWATLPLIGPSTLTAKEVVELSSSCHNSGRDTVRNEAGPPNGVRGAFATVAGGCWGHRKAKCGKIGFSVHSTAFRHPERSMHRSSIAFSEPVKAFNWLN